jgi:hypothetical protein
MIDRRMSPVRLLALLSALCLGTALAGCGKAVSKDEYVRAVAEPLGQVDAALGSVAAASSEDLQRAAENARPRLLAAADALDGIDPAKGLSEAHSLLVQGIRELADDVVAVAGESDSQDIPEILDAIEAMPSLAKLRRAQELFEREEVTLELPAALEPATSGPGELPGDTDVAETGLG